MNRFILIFISALLLFSAPLAFSGDTIWVSSTGAKLKADKKSSSETIATLSVGTALNVISYKKRWYNVSTESGQEGWIYRGKVSTTPPEEAEGSEGGDFLGGLASSSINEDSADSDRSIRGLTRETNRTTSKETKEYADRAGVDKKRRQALDKLFTYLPGESAITRFLKQGKIGEYAE